MATPTFVRGQICHDDLLHDFKRDGLEVREGLRSHRSFFDMQEQYWGGPYTG